MAFLLCVEFGGYGGMRILLYCVAHPLTGRYVLGGKNEFKGSCRSILGSNEN